MNKMPIFCEMNNVRIIRCVRRKVHCWNPLAVGNSKKGLYIFLILITSDNQLPIGCKIIMIIIKRHVCIYTLRLDSI